MSRRQKNLGKSVYRIQLNFILEAIAPSTGDNTEISESPISTISLYQIEIRLWSLHGAFEPYEMVNGKSVGISMP